MVRSAAWCGLRLRLRPLPHAIGDFLVVTTPPHEPGECETLVRMALLVDAIYNTTNSARCAGGVIAGMARDMITQALVEGARGHDCASRALADAQRGR